MESMKGITETVFGQMGVAVDSIIPILFIGGLTAISVFVIGLVFELVKISETEGLARRKPLFFPSIAFAIAILIAFSLYPTPMTQYHGLHEKPVHFKDSKSVNFTVYGGEIYSHSIDVKAMYDLERFESLVIDIDVYLDGDFVTSSNLTLVGSSLIPRAEGEVNIRIDPGKYEIRLTQTLLYNEIVQETETYVSCVIGQPLRSGMFEQVLDWESYRALTFIGAFFLVLAGICIGKEDRKRFRKKSVDKEPPREGEVYVRRWS